MSRKWLLKLDDPVIRQKLNDRMDRMASKRENKFKLRKAVKALSTPIVKTVFLDQMHEH